MKKRSFEAIGETLYEGTLDNGLRVCVVPKKGFRSCYAVLAADYGSIHRRFRLEGRLIDTPAGTAHYLEHKMFDLPDGDSALSLLTANGADPNASTGPDLTAYFFQCADRLEENLRLLLHFVSTPYFTEETVEKERGIITQEILMGEDDPGLRLYYRLLQMLYERHPVRDRVAGTTDSIREISADTLRLCHRAFYAPGNMVLCVEGDVDPERVFAVAREALPGEAQPLPETAEEPEESLLPAETYCRESADLSAPQFLIGVKFAPAEGGEALLRQRLTATLAMRTLFGSSSPFYNRLYARGLLNRDYDYEADFIGRTAMLLIGGESADPDAVAEELRREIAALNEHGLDSERFRLAKRASIGAKLRGLEDFESVCFASADGLLNGFCALSGPGLLESISREDCEAFLRGALRPERLAVAVYEPKKEGSAHV